MQGKIIKGIAGFYYVHIAGKGVYECKAKGIFRKNKIGFIFQQYNLIPMLSVWENIILPLKMDGRAVDKEYVMEIVNILGIQEKLKNVPNELSGGQQQRVAIARALAIKPALILADVNWTSLFSCV